MRSGLKKDAKWVLAEGADARPHGRAACRWKNVSTIALWPTGKTARRLRPEQGYPLRLIVPGWEGSVNIKYLRRLKIGDQPTFSREKRLRNTPS